MSKRLLTLFKWHIASHRTRAWQRVLAACEGDEIESEETRWRYCDLHQVDSILTVEELSRFLTAEFPYHWEPHSASSGFARVDDMPAPPEDEEGVTTDSPCANGKCPCCYHTARSRDCWCSWKN